MTTPVHSTKVPARSHVRSTIRGVALGVLRMFVLFILAGLMAVMIASSGGREGLLKVSAGLHQVRPYVGILTAVGVYCAAAFWWDALVSFAIRRLGVPEQKRTALLNDKWRIALVLWAVDAVLVLELPFSLIEVATK